MNLEARANDPRLVHGFSNARSSRRRPFAIAAIVGVALALRIWGSFIGLPQEYQPDEHQKVDTATHLAEKGFHHPAGQPGFLYVTLWGLYRVAGISQSLLHPAPSPAPGGAPDRSMATRLWLGRLWLDALSAATIVPVFILGTGLSSTRAGLLGSVLLGLNPVAIASANYLKEDTPVTFWLAVTALAAVGVIRRPSAARLLLAGLAAGLAIGSKFVGIFGLLILGPPLLLIDSDDLRRTALRRCWIALLGVVVGACLVTPLLVLDPAEMLRGVIFQLHYAVTGHHDGIALPLSKTFGIFYLRRVLVPSLGWLALPVVALGLSTLWRADRAAAAIVAAWSLGYLAVVEAMPAKPYPFFGRYVLPAIPGICVLMAIGSETAIDLLGRASRRIPRSFWAVLVMTLLLAVPVLQTARFLRSMYPDTRDEAAEWLEHHLPEKALVLASPYAPVLPRGRFRVLPVANAAITTRILDRQVAPIFVVLSDLATARFAENPDANPTETRLYRMLDERGRPLAEFHRAAPRFGFYNPSIRVLEIDPADASGRSSSNAAYAPTSSTDSTIR